MRKRYCCFYNIKNYINSLKMKAFRYNVCIQFDLKDVKYEKCYLNIKATYLFLFGILAYNIYIKVELLETSNIE